MARQRRSQREVAEAVGLSQVAVSRRLLGAVDFEISELIAVAEFLGVDVRQFLPAETTEATA